MEFINEHTGKSIDLEYILGLINPQTPYGIQKKWDLKPFRAGQEDQLKEELNKVETIIATMNEHEKEYRDIDLAIHCIKEIRGSLKRAAQGFVLDEVELFEIKNFILSIKDLQEMQAKIKEIPEELRLFRAVDIEKALDPDNLGGKTFYIYDSYSEELKKIREHKRELQREFDSERRRIISLIEETVGAKLKLCGEVTILKKDGERLIKARNCPYLSEGPSTLLMTTFSLKNTSILDLLAEKIEETKSLEDSEEYGVRRRISSFIAQNLSLVEDLINRLGAFDLTLAKAKFAVSIGGTRPIIHDEARLSVEDGIHIKLDRVLREKKKEFVPISFAVEVGVTVITGANMGGKTVSLKIAGMLTAMAHFGLFVPARKFETCLFDYIYFSIGDMQSIDSGLSTFGSEICGMIDIIKHSSSRGLILIDELARGTNPNEGYAISRALVRYLNNSNAVVMFTTHFDGITKENGVLHLQVRGLKDADFESLMRNIKENKAGMDMVLDYMDYRLEKVQGDYSVPEDAINIARLMGLDENILALAEELLQNRGED